MPLPLHAVDAAPQVESGAPSPEDAVDARQRLALLPAAIEELPERMRIALRLHRIDGLTFKEIALQLGISVGQAHMLVTQALEHCRERLFRH